MSSVPELIKLLRDSSKQSERSQQVKIGPSELGGCRRRTWYKLNNQPITNENVLVLSALMGTAIHSHIQKVLEASDPKEERFLTEVEVEADGMVGHIDLYDKVTKEVIDWKSTTKKNIGYFPSQQQRWQVQTYGYLLMANGYEVEKVTLVAMSRDGDERDIVYHSERYEPSVANEALAWLKDVNDSTDAPPPEKDATFCKHYCPYYDETGVFGCVGRGKADAPEAVLIEDPLVDKAAQEYLDLGKAIKALESKQEQARAMLEGHNGRTLNGFKVKWSVTAGRTSVDEDEVLKALGFVPKKQGKESYRLTVKD